MEYTAVKIIMAIYFHFLSVFFFEIYIFSGKKSTARKRNTHILSQKYGKKKCSICGPNFFPSHHHFRTCIPDCPSCPVDSICSILALVIHLCNGTFCNVCNRLASIHQHRFTMGKQKKTRKFAVAKKIISVKDPRM